MSKLTSFDGIHYSPVESEHLVSSQDGEPATTLNHATTGTRIIQEKLRRMPLWGVIFNVALFMAIPYNVPATVATGGWTTSIIAMIYFTYSTYETGTLLGEISKEYPDLSTYPAVGGEAFARIVKKLGIDRMCGISQEDTNKIGEAAILILQYITYYLISLVGLIIMAQLAGQLFENSGICQTDWLLIVFAASIPVIQIPTFTEASWMGIILALSLLINVIVFFYEIALVRPWTCGPVYGPPTVTAFFNSISNFVNLFAGHGMFPEILREMADKRRWGEVMNWTYGTVIPMYCLFGFFGYLSYGKFANPQLNFNFPKNLMNKFSISFTLIQQLVFMFPCNAVIFLGVELWLGVDPTLFWKGRKFGLPPAIFRFIWRTTMLASQVVICWQLIGGDGTNLFSIQALTAAVGMTGFNIFLPYIFYNALLGHRVSPARKAWHGLSSIIGVIVMFAGITFSMKELIEYNQGRKTHCSLVYTYSPNSEDDPCYES